MLLLVVVGLLSLLLLLKAVLDVGPLVVKRRLPLGLENTRGLSLLKVKHNIKTEIGQGKKGTKLNSERCNSFRSTIPCTPSSTLKREKNEQSFDENRCLGYSYGCLTLSNVYGPLNPISPLRTPDSELKVLNLFPHRK